MQWHAEREKPADDPEKGKILTHPADASQWNALDIEFADEFGSEPRNIRLGMSTDGLNPFGNQSSTHSTWPVFVWPYNLPPAVHKAAVCTHEYSYSGAKTTGRGHASVSRSVERGVSHAVATPAPTWDAYKRDYFPLRAALLTTVQDYPGYAYVSCQVNHGFKGCVKCMDKTPHLQLPKPPGSCKTVFQGTRMWLRFDHPWRKRKDLFNGEEELERAPRPRSGEEISELLENWEECRERSDRGNRRCWEYGKRGLFSGLPYWKVLHTPHSLDVMHITKVTESLLGTLMNMPERTKDGPKARTDLKLLGLKKELQYPTDSDDDDEQTETTQGHHKRVKKNEVVVLKPACFTLSEEELERFFECLLGNYLSTENEDVGLPTRKHVGRLAGFGHREGYRAMHVGIAGRHADFDRAHRVALQHIELVSPWVDKHKSLIEQKFIDLGRPRKTGDVTKEHNSTFTGWLKKRLLESPAPMPSKEQKLIFSLSQGPGHNVRTYQSYDINGYRFYTEEKDKNSEYQNSGVTMLSYTDDKTDVKERFYGRIEEIWELDYVGVTMPMFRVRWAKSVEKDGLYFTTMVIPDAKSKTPSAKNEPWVLASQVDQCFFITDPSKPSRVVVRRGKRSIIGMEGEADKQDIDKNGDPKIEEEFDKYFDKPNSKKVEILWRTWGFVRHRIPTLSISSSPPFFLAPFFPIQTAANPSAEPPPRSPSPAAPRPEPRSPSPVAARPPPAARRLLRPRRRSKERRRRPPPSRAVDDHKVYWYCLCCGAGVYGVAAGCCWLNIRGEGNEHLVELCLRKLHRRYTFPAPYNNLERSNPVNKLAITKMSNALSSWKSRVKAKIDKGESFESIKKLEPMLDEAEFQIFKERLDSEDAKA
ncbi:hypothetical protein QYE76_068003 [Lolium multiflorum]|uniref:Uncharacterized protein n=1 Tax=Lolium multiflorum TaxID=4521 RepID=A0AAD8SEL2_LOLMU|nr:hypothetical protein QYE76_068003 [Lolium multiflorum]